MPAPSLQRVETEKETARRRAGRVRLRERSSDHCLKFVLTLLKALSVLVPMVLTATMTTAAMPAAIRPYS